MQLSPSTAQVTSEPPTQVAPAPVQPAGAAGHWHEAFGAVPWQVFRPVQATSALQVVQSPTATQVCRPVVPQR
jgi:hypothetical protein